LDAIITNIVGGVAAVAVVVVCFLLLRATSKNPSAPQAQRLAARLLVWAIVVIAGLLILALSLGAVLELIGFR
jgi:hypothetical protein